MKHGFTVVVKVIESNHTNTKCKRIVPTEGHPADIVHVEFASVRYWN